MPRDGAVPDTLPDAFFIFINTGGIDMVISGFDGPPDCFYRFFAVGGLKHTQTEQGYIDTVSKLSFVTYFHYRSSITVRLYRLPRLISLMVLGIDFRRKKEMRIF